MIDITFVNASFGYVFVLDLLFILRKRGIKKEKVLLLATIRMTFQPIIMGYVLIWLFDIDYPALTLFVVSMMIVFSIYTIFRKFKGNLSGALKRVIVISLPLGGLPVLFYFLWVVIQIEPMFNPQYVIPITGTIIGNSMLGMGIIFLPGMMTGQILSGVLPTTAILYQIAIMLGIMGSVSLTSYLVLRLGVSTFLNKHIQLNT